MQCYSTCYPRYYPSEITNVCIGCPYDCLTCNFQGFCLTCSDADNRVFNYFTLRCIPISGYYDAFVPVCSRCPNECSTCQNPTFCMSCTSGFYLHNNMCVSYCPVRFYADNSTLTCNKCPYDCLNCNNLGMCLTCSLSDHRIYTNETQRCVPM